MNGSKVDSEDRAIDSNPELSKAIEKYDHLYEQAHLVVALLSEIPERQLIHVERNTVVRLARDILKDALREAALGGLDLDDIPF